MNALKEQKSVAPALSKGFAILDLIAREFEADADGSYLVGLTESQITDVPVTSMMGLMDRTFRRPKNPWWLQLRDVTRAVAEEPEPADA